MTGGFRRVALLQLPVTLLACTAPGVALAQRIDQYLDPDVPGFDTAAGVTVTSRLHPEYDFPGVRFGSVLLHADATEAAGFDSNVTGSASPHGGAVAETQAQLSATSDQGSGSIGATMRLDDTEYPGFAGQSTTDWQAQLGTEWQIGRNTLQAGFTHLNLDQSWRDLDVPRLDHPIAYRVDDGRVAWQAALGRLTLDPVLDVAGYGFDNGSIAGAPYLQSYRDRVVVAPGISLGYLASTGRSLVLVVNDADAGYRQAMAGVPARDFNDVSVLGGVAYDVDGAIRLRALAGYETRRFRSRQYPAIAAPIVEFTASWQPDGLTTFTASASRYIEDSAAETTTGYAETAVKLAVDHEYRRNVVLHADAGFYNDRYPDGGGSQSFYTATAGVTWLVNRHLRLAATYVFSSRQSGDGQQDAGVFGGSYRDHRAVLQLKIGF